MHLSLAKWVLSAMPGTKWCYGVEQINLYLHLSILKYFVAILCAIVSYSESPWNQYKKKKRWEVVLQMDCLEETIHTPPLSPELVN